MELQINDTSCHVEADSDTPLLWVLRDELRLTGTKYGCGLAQCGACSVLIDGAVVRSCVTPIDGLTGRKITTIEAVEADTVGKRVVAAWVKHQVPQCGYCQSGQVMAATALLKQTPRPTDEEIAGAMLNLCRCGTYNAIRAAVRDLAGVEVSAPAPPTHASIETISPLGDGVRVAASAAVLLGIGAVTLTSASGNPGDNERGED
ncbi:(2Fe-2S)-binding protein [Paraburkholderia sp. SIMBA_054]|uniref:(2Fe-2S)-binding protein n=1 Tax=Paraburkholderia sp. SIMBA_054 TaxID=3085795 RepID=UPI00397B373C